MGQTISVLPYSILPHAKGAPRADLGQKVKVGNIFQSTQT